MRYREQNNNWKGGRSVASNGYVLIRVGVGHHLADVRGYAYEHRLVAESKLGRRLVRGEQVHHVDGNKQNNSISNIEVVSGIAAHRTKHRKAGCKLRLPGEDNPLVDCACGCGGVLARFDPHGRPRRFMFRHSLKSSRVRQALRDLMSVPGRVYATGELVSKAAASKPAVYRVLNEFLADGSVYKSGHGKWTVRGG